MIEGQGEEFALRPPALVSGRHHRLFSQEAGCLLRIYEFVLIVAGNGK